MLVLKVTDKLNQTYLDLQKVENMAVKLVASAEDIACAMRVRICKHLDLLCSLLLWKDRSVVNLITLFDLDKYERFVRGCDC